MKSYRLFDIKGMESRRIKKILEGYLLFLLNTVENIDTSD